MTNYASKVSTSTSSTTSTPSRRLTSEQERAVDRLFDHDHTLLLAGMGFGKAVVALTAAQEMLCRGYLERVLVLAPKRVCELTWATEQDHWGHLDLRVAVATGTPKQRLECLASGAEVVVTNFENVPWVLEQCGDTFDGLIIDEITKLKAAGGAATRKLRHFTKKLRWRVGMTGTLVAEDALDLYAPMLLIDLGASLGTLKGGFQRRYFTPVDYQQRQWRPLPGSLAAIADRCRGTIYCAEDGTYLRDLPEIDDRIIEVDMPPDLASLYSVMDRRSVVTVGERTVTAGSAGVKVNKLQQLAAGGLYPDDDGGDSETVVESVHHKRDAIVALVSDLLAQDRQVIITYTFDFERRWLASMYPDAPVLGGGGNFTAAQQSLWNRGDMTVPVLLGHPRSMSHGLNVQYGGCDLVHASPMWSADAWRQCVARLCRRGQPSGVVRRWVVVSRDTIEAEQVTRQDLKATREDEFMTHLRNA